REVVRAEDARDVVGADLRRLDLLAALEERHLREVDEEALASALDDVDRDADPEVLEGRGADLGGSVLRHGHAGGGRRLGRDGRGGGAAAAAAAARGKRGDDAESQEQTQAAHREPSSRLNADGGG